MSYLASKSKQKIINDPLYGFIRIHNALIYSLIEEPHFQRLRRIRQLGLTELVYPGAIHTRFHHALGAMYLMSTALDTLRSKGHAVSDYEYESALAAILLHDVGHAPFSHTLESTIIPVSHERISKAVIRRLNEKLSSKLDLALQMFCGDYERKFFHSLISGQCDTDRLDYLNRDSFFTGVSEGKIGAERIIKMLELVNDDLVVEEKGIYSIENFLVSRRLMYWQVYLHKTTVSAEEMLIKIVERARELSRSGEKLSLSPALCFFFEQDVCEDMFDKDERCLEEFMALDDYDIWSFVKNQASHADPILSLLCRSLIQRRLFGVRFSDVPFEEPYLNALREQAAVQYRVSRDDARYLVITGGISNAAYLAGGKSIYILTKKGEIKDVADASDLPNIKAMSTIVKKYYLCVPKDVSL